MTGRANEGYQERKEGSVSRKEGRKGIQEGESQERKVNELRKKGRQEGK
jgi:hypothetical protein